MSTEHHGDITIRKADSSGLVADQRLYSTKDGRVVHEGHPEANTLICPAGCPIPQAAVEQYGLKETRQKREEAEEEQPKSAVKDDEKPKSEPAKPSR